MPSHLDDPSPEELREHLDEVLSFASKHVASPSEMVEIASDPSAVHACNRYHGERYDFAQRFIPEAGRGRGECSDCQHTVYFDDRPKMGPKPAHKLCLNCLLDRVISEGAKVTVPESMACPRWCPWLAKTKGQSA